MRRRVPVLLALAAVLVTGCGVTPYPGDEETDRIASVVADAIGYPRQSSAAGYTRAAELTTAGRDGRLDVIGAEELEPERPVDPLARLVLRVQVTYEGGGLQADRSVTACYRADFNAYGVIGGPRRAGCPAGAQRLPLPPDPHRFDTRIPVGFDRTLRASLATAADRPDPTRLRARLLAGLDRAPAIDVLVAGTDVGVALHADDGGCLLGSRTGGLVRVYEPPAITVQPGENSCDARTALGPELRPPH